MNRFNDTHPQKATDHTVLMVYNTSIDTKIFTFQLPGWCVKTTLLIEGFNKNSRSDIEELDKSTST